MNTAEKIEKLGVLPIIRLERVENARKLAAAFKRAGMPLAEVVFRTKDADKVISGMKEAFPEMTLGAGTILTTAQVERAQVAGAEFILSPGTDTEIIDCCNAHHLHGDGCADERQAWRESRKVLPGWHDGRGERNQCAFSAFCAGEVYSDQRRWFPDALRICGKPACGSLRRYLSVPQRADSD